MGDTAAEALKRIAQIIEHVDNRAMAADGPVTPTLQEMTQEEIGEIYALSAGSTPEPTDHSNDYEGWDGGPLPEPTERANLRLASLALVEQIEHVHKSPEYQRVWELAQIHQGQYFGPTYTEQLLAAHRALSREDENDAD